jgi:hypothetical protein
MANDSFQLDPSLQPIPVTGQPSGIAATLNAQPLNPAPTLQDLRAYLPQSQQSQQQQSNAQQQKQVSGRAPASIRYNNPGAMWPGPSSKKFGSSSYGVLRDGNLIAKFDDPVSGAAAQFDLLNSKKYMGRSIGDLIGEWSGYTGGKANVTAYANHVANSVGLDPNDRLTPDLLASPSGIGFAKAMARMEAGSEYPLSDNQWTQAQKMALGQQGQPSQSTVAQTQPTQGQMPNQIASTGGQQWQDLSQYLK